MQPFKFTPTKTPEEVTLQIVEASFSIVPGGVPVFVPRNPGPAAAEGQSAENVRSYLLKNPGKLILGWEITHWSKVLIHFAGHAVVEEANGEYLCVTPSASDKTLFLPDPCLQFDIDDTNAQMPSRTIELSSNSSVKKYIETSAKDLTIRQRYAVNLDSTAHTPADRAELHKLELTKQAAMLNIILFTHDKDSACVCGSGKVFRKCHKPGIEALLRNFNGRC